MPSASRHRLFGSASLALGHMVVERDGLRPVRVPDALAAATGGAWPVQRGRMAWQAGPASCQIDVHIAKPTRKLPKYGPRITREAQAINAILARQGLCLLPSAAHPFLVPAADDPGWYPATPGVDRMRKALFDPNGHGCMNSCASRLFLPFGNDEEFGRLHAAVRLVLPLVPAIAAASPFLEGRATGFLDARMEAYLHQCDRHPDLIGNLVPEAVFSQEDYYREIFQPIGKVLGPLDPGGAMDHEAMNLRGATAHFERGLLEIRVADKQECASADVAIADFLIAVTRALVQGRWVSNYLQRAWEAPDLMALFLQTMKDGPRAVIANKDYLLMFGVLREQRVSAQRLWEHLHAELGDQLDEGSRPWIEGILREGPLAARLMKHCGRNPDLSRLVQVHGRLAECLAADRRFA